MCVEYKPKEQSSLNSTTNNALTKLPMLCRLLLDSTLFGTTALVVAETKKVSQLDHVLSPVNHQGKHTRTLIG